MGMGGGSSNLYIKQKIQITKLSKKTPFLISKLYCQPLKVCPPLTINFFPYA